MSLLFLFPAAEGGVTHFAAVAFTGIGTTAHSAIAVRAGAVAFTGTGTTAHAPIGLRSALVAFTGTGTTAHSATVTRAALVAWNATATTAQNAIALRAASVAYNGAGTVAVSTSALRAAQFATASGAVFLSAGYTTRRAAVAFTNTPSVVFASSATVVEGQKGATPARKGAVPLFKFPVPQKKKKKKKTAVVHATTVPWDGLDITLRARASVIRAAEARFTAASHLAVIEPERIRSVLYDDEALVALLLAA